jgi:ABC-type uncharacterized transport system substrate-binding protein
MNELGSLLSGVISTPYEISDVEADGDNMVYYITFQPTQPIDYIQISMDYDKIFFMNFDYDEDRSKF